MLRASLRTNADVGTVDTTLLDGVQVYDLARGPEHGNSRGPA